MENPKILTDSVSSASGYLCPLKRSVVRIWVDVKTDLPVRAEGEIFTGKGFLTRFKEVKIDVVAYDLRWDVEIDDAIFDLKIPDDYKPVGIPGPG